MDLAKLLKQAERFTIDNSPAILTAFGVTGTLVTAYLTGKATFKAAEILAFAENNPAEPSLPLTPREQTERVWKLYIPPVAAGALTVTAIIGANHISGRRAAGLAAAYSISERAFSEYKEKVVEKLGEKKEREYRDELAQDRVNRNPVDSNQVIITDNGEVLCFDHFTGRYFKSSMPALKHAENEVNHLILHQGYASVSDLYLALNLPVTSFSEEVGWNSDHMLNLVFSTVMSEDNRPCISIDFDLSPKRKYSHFAGE